MKNRTKGFSIIELLIVIGIIILIFGIMATNSNSVGKQTSESRAKADIARLELAIESYRNDDGLYPAPAGTNSALMNTLNNITAHNPVADWPNWFGPYLDLTGRERDGAGNFLDPWMRPYVYTQPGIRNPASFDVFSRGIDGVANTADDINNWSAN